MAWLLIAPYWRDLRLLRLEVDLHQYSVLTAESIAREKVAEAFANGFGEVVLRHGSSTAGKGGPTIRARLRELVEGGEFDRYLRRRGKERLWLAHDTYAALDLIENPRPRFPRTLRPLPRPDYPAPRGRETTPPDALPPGRGWSG